jgi:hypothetical protein
MKRLFLCLIAALVLAALGPLPSAEAWWWHHSGTPNPAGVGADKNAKSTKTHHEKAHHEKTPPLHAFPKSVGWFHKTPGPMGAGSGNEGKTQTAQNDDHAKGTSTQTAHHHKSLLWWRHHDAPTPAPTTAAPNTTASTSDNPVN